MALQSGREKAEDHFYYKNHPDDADDGGLLPEYAAYVISTAVDPAPDIDHQKRDKEGAPVT